MVMPYIDVFPSSFHGSKVSYACIHSRSHEWELINDHFISQTTYTLKTKRPKVWRQGVLNMKEWLHEYHSLFHYIEVLSFLWICWIIFLRFAMINKNIYYQNSRMSSLWELRCALCYKRDESQIMVISLLFRYLNMINFLMVSFWAGSVILLY